MSLRVSSQGTTNGAAAPAALCAAEGDRVKALLTLLLLLAVAGCAARTVPVSSTPYDAHIERLNRRLCDETGSPVCALQRALEESRRFRYAPDPPGTDLWKTPREFEAAGRGDCKDFAVWTIRRAWALARGLDVRLVVGRLKFGGIHAWVELVAGEEVWWADPTARRQVRLAPAAAFHDRVPRYAYRFDGIRFGEPVAYAASWPI